MSDATVIMSDSVYHQLSADSEVEETEHCRDDTLNVSITNTGTEKEKNGATNENDNLLASSSTTDHNSDNAENHITDASRERMNFKVIDTRHYTQDESTPLPQLSPARRGLSPKTHSSAGSSFESTSNHTFDTLDTFSNPSPTSANNDSARRSPGAGIMREDSFDRLKTTYRTSFKAETKMERAKVLGINEYTFLRTLGKGSFAEVKLAAKSKLPPEEALRGLDVHHYERYAIKIIKKNFLQDKRKFQYQSTERKSPPPSTSVSFLPSVVEDAGSVAVTDAARRPQSSSGTPSPSTTAPRPSGRALRMKNKKFQKEGGTPPTASATTAVTSSTPAESVPPMVCSNSEPKLNTAPISNSPATSSFASSAYTSTPPRAPISHPQSPAVAEEVLQEIEILKYLRHKNLVKLCEIIDDPSSKHLYVVMEYVEAGPVMTRDGPNGDFTSRLTGGVLLESMASKIFRDLMDVLEYLHINHIAHRDLKPDNLLVDFRGNLKVSDFGISCHFSGEKRKKAVNMRQLSRSKSRGVVNSTEGTFAFYSPEMCRENSGAFSAYMSDVWAAAVCLWIFTFGKLPLYTPDVVDLFTMIRHHEPTMPHRVSPELDNLFQKILHKEQEQRLSIHDIQNHCWLKRTPLRGSGISSDDFETSDDLNTSMDDTPQLLIPRMRARVIRWAEVARETCAQRSKRYSADMDRELESMLRRSSLSFKGDGTSLSYPLDEVDDSSDDDDPLARLVSYDVINDTVLEDIKRHEDRQATIKTMSSLAEVDERLITPPKPKKKMRVGRKSQILAVDKFMKSHSYSSSVSDVDAGEGGGGAPHTPVEEVHERLTKEAIVELELEAYSQSVNKQKQFDPKNSTLRKKSIFCCFA